MMDITFNRSLKSLALPILLLFLLSMLSFSAYAVSITPGLVKMDFVPYAKVDLSFTVDRTPFIEVILEPGDLAGYIKMDDPMPNGTPRTIDIHITMPEKMLKPGKNIAYIQAKEINPNPRAMVALAAVRVPIVINVPYPGYYADMSFEAPNVNAGEPEDFKMIVTNLGTNDLANVHGTIDVYDGPSKIKSISTESQSLVSNARAEIITRMSTVGIKPGTYRAVATLYYDGGNTLTKESSFNIGTLYMQIDNYTSEIEQGKINRFDIEVESRWNNPIENVHGTIMFEGVEVQTPSHTFGPWEKKILSGYIDTANQAYGDHDIQMTVYYSDKTTVEDGKVRLVPPSAAKEPEKEEPKAIDLKLTPTAILIIVIVILVLVDINWLVLRNRPAAGKAPAQVKGRKNK
jgi:hypothetical protein